MKELIDTEDERKVNQNIIELDLLLFYRLKPKYLIARYLCVIALEKDLNIYSWLWLLLPNWRYYLRRVYTQKHLRFGRYSDHYWKPKRFEIWRINGYKYKLIKR